MIEYVIQNVFMIFVVFSENRASTVPLVDRHNPHSIAMFLGEMELSRLKWASDLDASGAPPFQAPKYYATIWGVPF